MRSELSNTFKNNYLNMGLIDRERYGSLTDLDHSARGSPSPMKGGRFDSSRQNPERSTSSKPGTLVNINSLQMLPDSEAIEEKDIELNEQFSWQKIRNIMKDNNMESSRTEVLSPEEMAGGAARDQNEMMLQIARSLAKVPNVRPTDFTKLTEKQDHRNMAWSDPESVWIKVSLDMSDIANTSLQFCLWAYKTTEEKSNNKVIFESKIVGETYINLSIMFKDHSTDVFAYHKKPKQFNNKLWLHGICVGTIKGEIEVDTTPYLRQLVCGVFTEQGLAKSAITIMKDDKEGRLVAMRRTNPKLKQLVKYKDDLINKVYQLIHKPNNSKVDPKIRIDHIKELLISIKRELEKSDKNSIVSFVYQDRSELNQAQEIFIDLANHLCSYSDEVPEDVHELYYKNAQNALDRGELSLDSIGFSDRQKEIFKESNSDNWRRNPLRDKIKVCLEYQKLLYISLEASFKILGHKVSSCNARVYNNMSETS